MSSFGLHSINEPESSHISEIEERSSLLYKANNHFNYDPSRVRHSILGGRRWSNDSASDSPSIQSLPFRSKSFTNIKGSCSASLIFDSPTLFPNSLCPPKSQFVSSVSVPQIAPLNASVVPACRSEVNLPRCLPKASNRIIHSIAVSKLATTSRDSVFSAKSCPRTIRSFNARLNTFAQKGNYMDVIAMIESAQKGVIEVSGPLNTYSFTILLKAYCNAGNLTAARRLLEHMNSFDENQRPNRFTYNTLMNAFVRWDDIEGAAELFREMESSANEEIQPDHVTYTTLMKGYAANGNMEAASKLFERLRHHRDPSCRPNQVTYNTMLKGFAECTDMESADRLLQQMYTDNDCQPDIVSMNTIIGGYCRQGNMKQALNYLAKMRINAILPNAVTFHALIEGYVRLDDMENAQKLLDEAMEHCQSLSARDVLKGDLRSSWMMRYSF